MVRWAICDWLDKLRHPAFPLDDKQADCDACSRGGNADRQASLFDVSLFT
jgi:hypothetical protein